MLTTIVSLHALKYLNHTRHLPSLYPGSINVTELYLTGCHKFPKGLQKHRILKIQYDKQNKDECLKCRPINITKILYNFSELTCPLRLVSAE